MKSMKQVMKENRTLKIQRDLAKTLLKGRVDKLTIDIILRSMNILFMEGFLAQYDNGKI